MAWPWLFSKENVALTPPPKTLLFLLYEDNGIKYREYRALFYEDH
jgi:hypothetical protein